MADDVIIEDPGVIVSEHIVTENPTVRDSIAEQLNTALTTSQPLFIVAGVLDLTNFIEVPTYKVNLLDGYEEWTDMNKVTHHDMNAQKLDGTFSLKFHTIEDFETFMIVMKDYKKQNRSYDCSVYAVNMLRTYNVEMFVDFDPPNIMPYFGVKDTDTIEVTVHQRGNQYTRPVVIGN